MNTPTIDERGGLHETLTHPRTKALKWNGKKWYLPNDWRAITTTLATPTPNKNEKGNEK